MHKFDVKYTFDNYYEYYKFILVKQKVLRDIIFAALFVGIALYWLIDTSDSTKGLVLPIVSLVLAVACPLTSYITLPMLKKQLNAKQDDIDRTHIEITFTDDEVIYNNLTVKPQVEEPSTEPETSKAEVNLDAKSDLENKSENEDGVDGNKESQVDNEKTTSSRKEETIFKLQYSNFLSVKETKGLFLFYLDRQTVIIIPKGTYTNGTDFTEFKEFIRSKIMNKRVKFLK